MKSSTTGLPLCIFALTFLFVANGNLPELKDSQTYFISEPSTMQVLDVRGNKVANDVAVITYDPKRVGNPNQIWKIVPAGEGSYSLVSSKDENFFLSALKTGTGAIGVVVHKKSDEYYQTWHITQVGDNPMQFTIMTTDGKHSLKLKKNNIQVVLVKNVPASPNVWQFSLMTAVDYPVPSANCPCHPGSPATAFGNVSSEVNSGLVYFIKNSVAEKVLDVKALKTLNNNPVLTWEQKQIKSASNQMWKVSLLTTGVAHRYKFATTLPGNFLLTRNNPSVVIFQDLENDDANQWWFLIKDATSKNYKIKTSDNKFLTLNDNGKLVLSDNAKQQFWTFFEVSIPDPSNCPCHAETPTVTPVEDPVEFPTSYPCNILPGSQYIITAADKVALTVSVDSIDGTNVGYNLLASSGPTENQLWNVDATQRGFVFTSVKNPNLVLYYSEPNVVSVVESGNQVQPWKLEVAVDDSCYLKIYKGDKFVYAGIDNTTPVVLSAKDAPQIYQTWKFQQYPVTSTTSE